MKRILAASLSTLIVVISLTLPLATPVAARIYSVQPTNEDGGAPTDQFTTADPIFAIFRADIEGGEICVVDANGNGGSHCHTISSFVGTGWTLIAPGLSPGTYRLRASDNDPSYSFLSPPFTVTQCDPSDPACSAQRRMTDQTVAEWKENAKRSFTGFGEMCSTLEVAGSFKKPKVGRGFLFAKKVAEKAADDVNQQQKEWGWEGALIVVGFGYALGFTVAADAAAAQELKPYLALVKEVTCGAQQMYKDIMDDPPDPNYTTLVQPVFTQLPTTGDVISDRLALSIDRKQALGRAQLKSYERYLGAVAAGDETVIRLQAQAIADYGQALTTEMKESAAALRAWGDAQVMDSDINNPAVTQAELDAAATVFERVRTSGFTQDEINQLTVAGLSQDEIDRIRADYNRDLNPARVGVSLQTIANNAADALEASIAGFNNFSQEAAWLADSRAPRAVSLTPSSASLSAGATHTVSSLVRDGRNAPIGGIKVTLKVTGANPTTLTATTDASGGATFSYVGSNTGDDNLSATAWTATSNTVAVHWSVSGDAIPSVQGYNSAFNEGGKGFVQFNFKDADTQDTHTATIDWGDGSQVDHYSPGSTDAGIMGEANGSGFLFGFHTYADNGTYTATATIVDNRGAIGTGTATVAIANLAPRLGPITPAVADGKIVVNASFTDAGTKDTHTATLNWGDGTTEAATITEANGGGSISGTHLYAAPGIYTVTLVVTDNDGGTVSGILGLTIENGSLGNSPPSIQTTALTSFEGGMTSPFSFNDPDTQDTHTATIDWGDGSPQEAAQINENNGSGFVFANHAYIDNGTYSARVTLVDNHGAVDAKTVTMTVVNSAPTVSYISLQNRLIHPNETFKISTNFTDHGIKDTHTAVWDWGDGTTSVGVVAEAGGSGTVSGEHVYAKEGVFTITATVTDNDGAQGSAFTLDPLGVYEARFASGSIQPVVTETGKISVSINGRGTMNATDAIQISKSNGATVRKAYLATATTGLRQHLLKPGEIKLENVAPTWEIVTPNSIRAYNFWADVTQIVKTKIDGAPAGLVDLAYNEDDAQQGSVDGSILVVIFDDPNEVKDNTVALLFGAQQTGGDEFALRFAKPIDKSDPNFSLEMSLGISYGYQGTVSDQYSIVDVNGQRMTTSAGGEDDGQAANGALLTVGGLGDDPSNPSDPQALPVAGPRSDDELYDLLPFVKTGDTSITVSTRNPSNDDNIFFSAFFLKNTAAVVGEGVVLAPVSASNPLGAQHTVTATAQDAKGNLIAGRNLTFEVVSGPHTGMSGSSATDSQGVAHFTYTGTKSGTDSIVVRFVDSGGQTQNSNTVTATWDAPASLPTVLSARPATGTYGETTEVSATLSFDGAPLADKNVGFSLNGVSLGIAVTDDKGVARLSNISLAGINAGTHANAVSAIFAGDERYAASAGSSDLTVGMATPLLTWNNPANIYYGTPLGDTQLNAAANVSGTFVYAPAANTILNAGPAQRLEVNFTPTDSNNYKTASASVLINVLKASQTITFATLPPKTIGESPFSLSAQASSGLAVSFTAAGSCTVNGSTLTMTGIGSCTVTASQGGDANYNAAPDVARTFSITGRTATTLTVRTPGVQYSDPVTLIATVSPTTFGGQSLAGTVQFTLNGKLLGSAPVSSNGVAVLPPIIINEAPGGYGLTAKFFSTNTSFTDSNGSTTLTVSQEDARAVYTGAFFINTSSQKSNTVTVTSSAMIQDITAVEPTSDPNAGDIRNATVTFVDRDTGATLCTAPVVLASSQDTKTGTATCTWTATLGSEESVQYRVGTIVGGHYTRDTASDDVVVTILKPQDGAVTGGGFLVLRNSSGQIAGDSGAKMNFGFNAKSNNTKSGPKGNVNIIVHSGGHIYQIKSRDISQLIVSGNKATLIATVSIQDITNRRPVSLSSNASLELVIKDNGEPGLSDTIAITVRNQGGGLWFSSSWNSAKTIEQRLDGGNIQVR